MEKLKDFFECVGALFALVWDYMRDFLKWISGGATFGEVLTACVILGLLWFGGLVLWAIFA